MQNEERVFETFLRQYREIFRVLINAAEQITSQYSVSFEQYLLLKQIHEQRNITLSELADSTRTTRSAAARKLRALLLDGFVEQEAKMDDRRVKYLRLTTKGANVEHDIRQAFLQSATTWEEIPSNLSGKDINEFFTQYQQNIAIWDRTRPKFRRPVLRAKKKTAGNH
ncbi:MAG: MarR family transcriptional regulator [Levilactobacillus sp.]|jgi:DNA-binding MarR family transcriptional regulator|uniref:MarR family transcriptional regulator n=1 Tax=Levilactobacillus suantsaiihabitans TaxID=2487722 RepID=A0A4Z0JFE3_9LACO|nr:MULTISPECIES: MarR family transcriptional regulator [Levilactobacillus]MCH4123588.1 MarR family transcriptional regulator [Levilactobacillus sp.]MCI1553687.1 MarR family transcriptional regulator [Levilactobacillus sp.]MCI1599186.1 MarR family transcriptional regulator [Levilactobacillus sp.]MCI1606309.1 MarR family transcriptional regulator [Levilactobacillus sp.]TGD20268.1 MarR family transcriptional regulator [Levilactobacillus suantsaiihabitans]